jgi:hypothetical protein
MNAVVSKHKIVIAVTATSSAKPLWRAAMDLLARAEGELIAVFVADERWERAAGLPFTREISSITGTASAFTPERAQDLVAASATRMRRKFEKMAARNSRNMVFEILSDVDERMIDRLVGDSQLTVIASHELSGSPVYLTLQRRRCEIVLVGDAGLGKPVDETAD